MIGLVDTTVRDGHQSLWSANALTTSMIADIAPVMDRVGFRAIDFTSSTHMAMTVKWHQEDPWERIRVVRELMPDTPLGFITPGMRFISWERAPVDVMRLALRCVDPERRPPDLGRRVDERRRHRSPGRAGREGGAAPRRSCSASSTASARSTPTPTTPSARASSLASPHVDILNLKDPGGLLTPERIRTLVPALREAAPALPLEVHSHNTVTMAGPSYLEAVRLGASFVCTAVRPLANGTSQPSAEQTLENLHVAGFDDGARRGRAGGDVVVLHAPRGPARPPGRACRSSTTWASTEHQLPGGMTSTLRRQLAEVGMEDRWDDVLAELPRVREALGWPIMVTPLSQFIGVQAFLNVTTGERWSQIPDEVVQVRARPLRAAARRARSRGRGAGCSRRPKAEQFRDEEHRLDLADARARYGDRISDEELLLRMTLPAEQVDAMRPGYRPTRLRSPVVDLIEGLASRPLREIEVEAPGLRLRVRR